MAESKTIPKFANKILFSDVEPFEVVRTVSPKCLEIRRMNAQSVQPATLIAPGGFVGHFDNSTQRWSITSDPENPRIKIRLSKKSGWRDANRNSYQLANEPRRVYDFNF